MQRSKDGFSFSLQMYVHPFVEELGREEVEVVLRHIMRN